MIHNTRRHLPAPVLSASAIIAVATILFVVLGWMPLINAALLLPFAIGLYYLTTTDGSHRALIAAILVPTVLIGFFVAIFRPKGFSYPLIWNPGALYEGGEPFSLYVNLSKAIGGYLVVIWLGLGLRHHRSTLVGERSLLSQMVVALVGVGAILFTAFAFYGVGWKPKIPDGILYFVVVNLLVTVLSEEAFFRLMLQSQIERFFKNKRLGICVGIVIASLLFALAHAGATGLVFFLFLFAGFIYAAVYAWTRSLLASMATHFGVNIAHILLLEYPL
ncbi:type II CAAX endopeptidase family protein [Saccharophagus sp. K07]|uniref:CPBP family intramembrane glutamic endopeptidase n=1 Tax=Saccharophagus sp. K07 TaxID=2283636 RepID=UPI0016526D1D